MNQQETMCMHPHAALRAHLTETFDTADWR